MEYQQVGNGAGEKRRLHFFYARKENIMTQMVIGVTPLYDVQRR